MKRGLRASPMRPTNEVSQESAQPINVTATGMNQQAALSPRTTRRNTLAAKLPKSLPRQLLWERSQKNLTTHAVLKRRHTSHDVAHLKQYLERLYMNERNNIDGGLDLGDSGYHAKAGEARRMRMRVNAGVEHSASTVVSRAYGSGFLQVGNSVPVGFSNFFWAGSRVSIEVSAEPSNLSDIGPESCACPVGTLLGLEDAAAPQAWCGHI